MAILFPISLVYKQESGEFVGGTLRSLGVSTCRLLVNPTQIRVKKTPSVSETRTMGGTVFQPWPNMPDEISFDGIMYGMRSYQDFRVLQNVVDQKPHLKEAMLVYKVREYRGYVTSMSVSAVADKPRVFEYSMSFKSKDIFSLTRMMLGQLTGYQVEVDYFKNVFYGVKNAFVTDPVNAGINAASIGLATVIDPKVALNIDTSMHASDLPEQQNVS